MKRHLVSSLLLAAAASGCSLVHVTSPRLNVPGMNEAQPKAEPSSTNGASEAKSAAAPEAGTTEPAKAKESGPPADVVHRLSGFTPEDSYSLAKIGAALKLATPDLVRYVPKAETYVGWQPTPYETGKFFRSIPDRKFNEKDCKAGGFRIQSGYRRELEEGLCARDDSFNHLAAGTPVLVWALKGTEATVVTLDGGRYWVERAEELAAHPDAAAAAAPPLQHTFYGAAELRKLAEIDPQAKPASEAAEATSDAYAKCNYAIFEKQEKEMTAASAGGFLTEEAREARLKPIGDRYRKLQEQSCDKHLGKMEKVLATFIEERNAARRKLWDDGAPLRASLAGK